MDEKKIRVSQNELNENKIIVECLEEMKEQVDEISFMLKIFCTALLIIFIGIICLRQMKAPML